MRSAVVLTQLALWAGTTHAFFPFTPKWLRERKEKEGREARRSIEESRDGEGVSFSIKQRDSQVCDFDFVPVDRAIFLKPMITSLTIS